MQWSIVAVGQRLPGWVYAGFDEYARRMPPEMRLDLREIKAEPRTGNTSPDAAMRAEATRIDAALPKHALLVVLDERGRDPTTVELAQQIEKWRGSGRDVAIVIGGADGLHPDLKARADYTMRVSSLTLPHGLVRVVLAEALYRAWTLGTGHPYHRA